LQRGRRTPDGMLHPSSHLKGSLRHAQLDVAGAPKVRSEITSEITLMTGTLWHEWLHARLRASGFPYMAEVNITPFLPKGWSGTLDALIWNPPMKHFILNDWKTQKGEGMRFIQRNGAKEEHIIQTSIYWHAAKKMGVPLAKRIAVTYIPKNDTRSKDEIIEPLTVDFDPLPAKALFGAMEERKARVDEYVDSVLDLYKGGSLTGPPPKVPLGEWITDALAPVQEREQRVFFDKLTGGYELKLMPHWSAAYCPYPDELCSCSSQGSTKLGVFDPDTGEYFPRSGFEDVIPVVTPLWVATP
jgi:hypothetical protein